MQSSTRFAGLALRSGAVRRAALPLSRIGQRFGSTHEQGYEPSGYLFGEKPLPEGVKRKWEPWEPLWWFGYCGVIAGWMVYHFWLNPRQSIQEVATIEAHKRLAERGETFGWPLPPDYAKVEIKRE